MDKWKPEKKILAGAIVAVAVWGAGLFSFEVPAEIGASLVVIVSYLVPN
jgi:hypothetical protein